MKGVLEGRWEEKNILGRESSHSCKGPGAHVAGEERLGEMEEAKGGKDHRGLATQAAPGEALPLS